MQFGVLAQCVIVVGMIATSWLLPRTIGLLGMLAAHLVVVAGWATMGCVALHTGIWDDYDVLTMIGMAAQAFLFNCLMLPISIWAMLEWKHKSPMSPKYVGGSDCGLNTRE